MESTKYYLGLDVGGTNMVAGVVDENHQIIAKESIPTQAGRTIEEITWRKSAKKRFSKQACKWKTSLLGASACPVT